MTRYEFKILTVERVHLRDEGAESLAKLNAEGAEGWHIIEIRDDPRDHSHLVVYLQRERTD
jgi:hypothetical protein